MTTINPSVYQAIAIKHALILYRGTGMKANSMYTPKNMMAMAMKITGLKFKSRDYTGAIEALKVWIDQSRA